MYNIFSTETEAAEAEKLLTSYPDIAVTIGIMDEVEFVIIRRLAKRMLGIRSLKKLREYIRSRGSISRLMH